MPYNTPNHGWPVPRDGEDVPADGIDGPLQSVETSENWGDSLQTLADALDDDVIIKDTIANRPAAGEAGRWFLSTDENPQILYYDDGASWVNLFGPFAQTSVNETVSGTWTFSPGLTTGGNVDVGSNRLVGTHGHIGIGDGGAFNFDATSADIRFNTGLTDLLWIRNDGDMELPNGGITQGFNPVDVITETMSPKSFNFDGGAHRDIHDQTDVTISNASTSSATETITVELYDGIDTTGTLVAGESQSVTVAAGASSVVTFLALDEPLDTGTYHIEITQSGTTLSIDQTDEHTAGAAYTLDQNATGQLVLSDQAGDVILTVDPIDDTVTTNRKVISSVPNGESNFVATVPTVGEPAKYMIHNPDLASNQFVTLTARDSEQYTVEATDDIDANIANRKKLFGVDADANFTAQGAVKASGGNVCTESADGNIQEFYVSASAPSTTRPYVRFEP